MALPSFPIASSNEPVTVKSWVSVGKGFREPMHDGIEVNDIGGIEFPVLLARLKGRQQSDSLSNESKVFS
jgi:hypothetical protein